jgi:hypothetical protein
MVLSRWLGPSATTALGASLLGLVVACGGNDSSPNGAEGGHAGVGGSATVGTGGSSGSEWEVLIDGAWSLSPADEGYTCVVATVPEDIYIGAFRPIAPTGTHHTVLTQGATQSDGVYPCSAGTNGENMLYGSGVGTEADYLPPGVAVKLSAGDKLLLNLHLFNASSGELTGISGVEVKRIDPADVVHEATSVLAGTINIAIPPQSSATATGYCTMPNPVTIFGVGPHMHQLGSQMKVTALTDAGDEVVHDAPYTFDDQRHFPVSPLLELDAGDQIRVDCTYDNPTQQFVTFGDSSNSEMCFAGLFLYPASSNFGLVCLD